VALARISKVTIEDLQDAFFSLCRDTSCRDRQGTPGAENRGIGQKFVTDYLVEELGEPEKLQPHQRTEWGLR
jgi:hypothetical protein